MKGGAVRVAPTTSPVTKGLAVFFGIILLSFLFRACFGPLS